MLWRVSVDHSQRPPAGQLRSRSDCGMTAELSQGLAPLSELRRPLAELQASVGAPVTARLPWLMTWAEYFPEYRPWTVTVRDGDDLRAVACLAVRRVLGINRVVCLGHRMSDRARLPVATEAAVEPLARGIAEALAGLGRPWSLSLEQLPAGDPVVHRLAELLPHTRVSLGDPLPVLNIAPGLSPEKYAAKKFRQQTRAARRRFQQRGLDPQLRYERRPDAIEPLLGQMRAIRRERDHDRGRRSELDDRDRASWWRAITLELAAQSELEAVTLHAGDRLVAYSLALLDGPTYRLWDGRFDPAYKDVWPGQLMYGELLQRLVMQGEWRQLDFMRGRTVFKDRLTNGAEECENLQAWSSPLIRRLMLAPTASRAAARVWKGKHPVVNAGWPATKRLILRVLSNPSTRAGRSGHEKL